MSMCGPMTASRAGSTTIAPTAAVEITPTPAKAKERRKGRGKTRRAARETATVSAEKATILPAVCIDRITARSGEWPFPNSSR